MYHRIADEPVDPWGLAVSPANFEEQLCVLRRYRYPLCLADFVERLVAGSLPRHAVALTFDDGYVDNLTAGKPRLAAADVPATVFLATGYLDQRKPFWWDELANLIFQENDLQRIDLIVDTDMFRIDLGTEDPPCGNCAAPSSSSERRHVILGRLWQHLRHLNDDERGSVMAVLHSRSAKPHYSNALGRPMTFQEVKKLMDDRLVTIGAHSVSHPVLSALDTPTCRREITESKLTCERLTEAPVRAFTYPYGDFNAETQNVARTAGFAVACSTRPEAIDIKYDIFALPRIPITNLDGDAFDQRLRWASSMS
jgi:peptidoglycan/xylan/chitin deacetylase (PgdA/CDA1 family)